MNVTRQVVAICGPCTPWVRRADTHALVEAFFRQDPNSQSAYIRHRGDAARRFPNAPDLEAGLPADEAIALGWDDDLLRDPFASRLGVSLLIRPGMCRR